MADYEKIRGGWKFPDGVIITRDDYNRVLSAMFGGDKRIIRAMKKTHEHEILCHLHTQISDMVRDYIEKHSPSDVEE